MNRRTFLKTGMWGAAACVWPVSWARAEDPSALRGLLQSLLASWGEGLLRHQVEAPGDAAVHGALRCAACGVIHGRCGDAVYPWLSLAHATGQRRYVEAALRLYAWTRTVDAADGAWTNDLDPKSWKGTTVFGATALAESLLQHGDLLPEERGEHMRNRLRKAADFIVRVVTPTYGNVNYPASATYALALLARVLEEPAYLARARDLAAAVEARFTESGLLYGEGKPQERISAKNARPVDLGYNVEESLPALAHYALLERDERLLAAVTASWNAHLRFMLPDGAWDNSWGTRNYKWTYWGSRTSDGALAALTALGGRVPGAGRAVRRQAELLRACTQEGLLAGGPHYASHGVPVCIHHTFTHAKAVAAALHLGEALDRLDVETPLPRENARGIHSFPEIDTHLVTAGPWRGTVTGYDWMYRPDVAHATGGALSMLWHERIGPVLAASLSRYVLAEEHNMQPLVDGEDSILTPRVELWRGGTWYTNLYDLSAVITLRDLPEGQAFEVQCRLVDAAQADPPGGPVRMKLVYLFSADGVVLQVEPGAGTEGNWALAVPVISPTGETVRMVGPRRCEITKGAAVLVVESDRPLDRPKSKRERVFNHVPGLEALPLQVAGRDALPLQCALRCS